MLMISKNIVILKTLFKALHSTGHALSQGTIEVWTIVKIWKQSRCATVPLLAWWSCTSSLRPLCPLCQPPILKYLDHIQHNIDACLCANSAGAPQHCCPTRLTHHPNNRIWMLWCVCVNLAMPEHLVHQHLFHRTFFFTSVIDQYGLTHTFLDIRQHAPNIFLQAHAISICEDLQSIYR